MVWLANKAMTTVEDLLTGLTGLIYHEGGTALSGWQRSFVLNVATYVQSHRALSTDQSRVIVSLAAKLAPQLVAAGANKNALDQAIANPQHRLMPFVSKRMPREVRHLGAGRLGFRFKFDSLIIGTFQRMRDDPKLFNPPHFDRTHRIWVVAVTRANLPALKRLIDTHRFEMDDETHEFFALACRSTGQASTVFVDPESGALVGNVCDNEMLSAWIGRVAGGVSV